MRVYLESRLGALAHHHLLRCGTAPECDVAGCLSQSKMYSTALKLRTEMLATFFALNVRFGGTPVFNELSDRIEGKQ
jgi:hypothetical protein